MAIVFKIAPLFLLFVCASGCRKDNPGGDASATKELTVLFSPGATFSGSGYDDAILTAVMESVANNTRIKYRLLRPEDIEQAGILTRKWRDSAKNNSALLLCGLQYGELAKSISPGRGRILLLDSDLALGNSISTIQLKRYGGAYLAGAMCSGFEKMYIIKAFDGDRMMDTVANGIRAGYSDKSDKEAKMMVLSDSYRGTNMPDELFSYLYSYGTHGMDLDFTTILVPVCGASRMGAYSFSNNYFVFSLGIGEDCSAFCDILPFSLVYDIGSIVKEYISMWFEGKSWPVHQDFGLSTGHVYIQYNSRYFVKADKRLFLKSSPCLFTAEQYKTWEEEYFQPALEMEVANAY